jgi:hypothetical protein
MQAADSQQGFFRRMRQAYRAPLRRAGTDFAQYAVLEYLWDDEESASFVHNIVAALTDMYSGSAYPLDEAKARIAIRELADRGLVRRWTTRRPPPSNEMCRITEGGARVFERVHTEALAEGAWTECHKIHKRSRRQWRVTAATEPGLFWALGSLLIEYFILGLCRFRRTRAWRYNRHKVFDRGIVVDVTLGRRVTEESVDEQYRSVMYELIHRHLDWLTSRIPPLSWAKLRQRR